MGNPGRKMSTATFFGVLLIVLGALWVLHNTHVINLYIRVWWPLILIIIGLLHLFRHRRFFDFTGWLITGLGVIFLLTENNIISRHQAWQYWPVFLVLLGISIVFNRGKWASHRRCCWGDDDKDAGTGEQKTRISGDDHVDETTMFGSITKKVTSKSFTGGSISVLFGGAEIDLRPAELAENGAVLDISAIFGGVEMRIPDSWLIENRSSAILGGVGAKISNTHATSGKRLVINASAIFGGVEIKN